MSQRAFLGTMSGEKLDTEKKNCEQQKKKDNVLGCE
jgi:hypothetical protein